MIMKNNRNRKKRNAEVKPKKVKYDKKD